MRLDVANPPSLPPSLFSFSPPSFAYPFLPVLVVSVMTNHYDEMPSAAGGGATCEGEALFSLFSALFLFSIPLLPPPRFKDDKGNLPSKA